jgi:hypothetical protein
MDSSPQPANQPARRRYRRRNLGERLPLGERLLLVSHRVIHFPARVKELWGQFRREALASYSLYSREIEAAKGGAAKGKLWWAKKFFTAVIDKLSPARRVVLLIALYILFFPTEISMSTQHGVHVYSIDPRLGGLLLFVLLSLEIADRVLMKRDLQIAREIQSWLLPSKPPEVPGVEIAFDTRPANTVAGDYYDVFPRTAADASAEPTYLIVVADVVGKSIPAALLMASLQTSLKILNATPDSLEQLVGAMNDYACSNSQGGLRFTTAFFAEYQPATRALTYINAGHNWPIIRSKSGRIAYLDRGGLPLGVAASRCLRLRIRRDGNRRLACRIHRWSRGSRERTRHRIRRRSTQRRSQCRRQFFARRNASPYHGRCRHLRRKSAPARRHHLPPNEGRLSLAAKLASSGAAAAAACKPSPP